MIYQHYRILNESEINHLARNFDKDLAHWNTRYARLPLTCTLEKSVQPALIPIDAHVFTLQETKLACLSEQDLSCIQYALFGENSPCFASTAKTLFCRLVQSLLHAPSAQYAPDTIDTEEWFYKGAPALTLRLWHAEQTLTLYLHPQWVLSALPQNPSPARDPLIPLDDALAQSVLHCQIKLNPIQLPLQSLMQLKPGDVIQTDHLLTTPLHLSHHQNNLCQVDIGKHHAYKSIQIKDLP